MTEPGALTVIGVGNVLRGDDAAGVHVVEGLRRAVALDPSLVPAGTRLMDGGTLALDLLRALRDARGVVLVDAARLGDAVGTVSVLRGDAVTGDPGASHDVVGPVPELVATARALGWLPADLSLVAIEAGGTELGLELSDKVRRAIGAAMDAVRAELRRMDEATTGDAAHGRATEHLAGVPGTAGATA